MVPIAVLDACVLYSAPVRDLLIRLARQDLLWIRWSEEILDETFAALRARRPDLDPTRLERTRRLMTEAFPDALVEDHMSLISQIALPDPDDRHVLAAAIRAGAQWIVTENVKDFPGGATKEHGISVITPDEIVLLLVEKAPDVVVQVVERQAQALRNPPCTLAELLQILKRHGLRRGVEALGKVAGT